MSHRDHLTPPMVSKTPSMISSPDDEMTINDPTHQGPFDKLGPAKKAILLAVFAMATAIDVLNISALLILTPDIAADLGLNAGNVTWVIVAYTLTFAGFLLFSGRLADIFPAQLVFLSGFGMLGILLLVSSFMGNKYAFLVLRALQGLAGSMTLPSAYHLIVHLYTDLTKQRAALAMIGLIAGISNSLGIVLGGVFGLGNASWRWLLRFLAILALCAFAVGALMMPLKKHTVSHTSQFSRLQRLDIGGAVILTSSLCLFILGLTSGTTDGWTSASFLAPFLISLALFVGFWVWEGFQHDEKALLPISLMRAPNLILLCFTALTPFLWWATIQFELANVWQTAAYGYSPILVAARLLPMGLTGLAVGAVVHVFPIVLQRPKYTVLIGFLLSIVPGLVLLILSDGGRGNDYWAFLFPSFFVGSSGMFFAFLAIQVSVIQALPPSASGVAGGLLQIFLQIGSVIGLSVSAGLFSRVNNDFSNWDGVRYFSYFDIAWVGFTMIVFAIFYRPAKVSHPVSKSLKDEEGEGIAMTHGVTGSKGQQSV